MKEQTENDNSAKNLLRGGPGKNHDAFQPPPGYFEQLEKAISRRIAEPEEKASVWTIWQPAWAFLLSVFLLTAVFGYLQTNTSKLNLQEAADFGNEAEEDLFAAMLAESGYLSDLEEEIISDAITAAELSDFSSPAFENEEELTSISEYLIDNTHYTELIIENKNTTE